MAVFLAISEIFSVK